MARGEFIRLVLEDAGVDFKYVRHSFSDWPEKKKELLAQKIRGPTLPYITVDGKYYGKTIPIMRFLSKKLGKYEGQNDDENQLLDSYSDLLADWASIWIDATFFGSSEDSHKIHVAKVLPQNLSLWNDILSDTTSGPFLLGDRITYPDFFLYHMLEDEISLSSSINADTHPHIAAFMKAIEARPNLSKYLASDRK